MKISKDFIILLGIANIIAWPVAYYAMAKMLDNYAYRIKIPIWIFLASGILAIMIALLTVYVRIIRAALANPIDSLRYE
jgi:putative ABC transport system permease protein